MNASTLYQAVKRTLERERVMRRRVFSKDKHKLHEKVQEIDDALNALEYLYKLAQPETEAKQAALF